MTILDGTSLLTALPSIERDLRLDGPTVQWTVTSYALAFSGPLLLCGRLADLRGGVPGIRWQCRRWGLA
jgi:MFS family permease